MLETRELLCFLTIARTSERGGDVIHKGLLFWRTFIRCCTGIISRAGLSYWFPDLQQIKTFVSHYHLCTEKCKEKLNDIFDIWTKKKKKKWSACSERSLIIAQRKRKPERPPLHSSSLPVAHSCARLHSRNAALRSVIVSVQWAWHGHSVKNNSPQK